TDCKSAPARVAKLYDYKYIIITEHIPSGAFSPNADIISGQGTRLKKQSGIDLLQAPFHFKPKESKELLSINLGDKKGVIKTWLYSI
ncbi:MAG: SAM-dependent methyltransferase, partial [Salibacteraceae bacterium]|nr:SAM-dependent methyltransferase [Salibacteraceae bacterium]